MNTRVVIFASLTWSGTEEERREGERREGTLSEGGGNIEGEGKTTEREWNDGGEGKKGNEPRGKWRRDTERREWREDATADL
jgi:hypothetical protein